MFVKVIAMTAYFMQILNALGNVLFAFVLQRIIDSVSTGSVDTLIETIIFSLIYLLLVILVSIGAEILKRIYVKSKVQDIKMNYFKYAINNSNVNLITDLTSNVDLLEQSYFSQRVNLVFYMSQFVFGMIAIIYISFTLTLGIILVTLIPIVVPMIFGKRVSNLKNVLMLRNREYVDFLSEVSNGKYVIGDYNLFDRFIKKHDVASNDLEKSRAVSNIIENSVDSLSQNLGMLTFITALGIGSYYTIIGKMTFGLLIAAVQLMNNLIQPLNGISYIINKLNSTKEIREKFNQKEISKIISEDTSISKIESIEFENVMFYYDESKIILDNFSHTFFSRNKYLLIGESGIGKSTLFKLITKELSPVSGSIRINGIDIGNISSETISSLIGHVRQESFLFNDSIENNIILWEDIKKNNLKKTLHISGLNNIILKEPDFVNRIVSNDTGLSGGQKKRINIARAVASDPNLYIFDEITSSIDIETGKQIMSSLLFSLGDKLMLFTSHNPLDLEFFSEEEIIRIG